MVSDEKRREVAERLRNASARRGDAPWMVEDLMLALGFRCYEDGEDQLFARLADLIDRPTCRNVSEHQDVFTCSECRCKVEIIGEECNEYSECFCVPFMPSFCPSCGAEVVDE